MSKRILRYTSNKPANGHFFLDVHADAPVIFFTEYWHSDRGWTLILDFVCDTDRQLERRHFLLCPAGTDLSFIGEYPEAYHLQTHEARGGYSSYLFDITHLSETDRMQGRIDNQKLFRGKPSREDMSNKQRFRDDAQRRDRITSIGEARPAASSD